MKKKLGLLLCSISVCNMILATTIVIYITPDFVIMAADSQGVYTDAKTYRQSIQTVSKIYKSGNVYFSLAGLISNETRSFNVAAIVNSKLVHASNLVSAINEIKVAVKADLFNYLTSQKRNNPLLYKANIEGEKYITSIGIVAIRNNRPYTHLIGFSAVDKGALQISTEEEVYGPNADKDAVYYLGTSDAINKYMNSIQRINSEPLQFVEKLMNLQIAKTPQLVATPIDILKITPKQTTWIKRKKGTPLVLK